jgi:hypothetical protein
MTDRRSLCDMDSSFRFRYPTASYATSANACCPGVKRPKCEAGSSVPYSTTSERQSNVISFATIDIYLKHKHKVDIGGRTV